MAESTARPESAPPPQFPDDDQFQPIGEHKRRNKRKERRKEEPSGTRIRRQDSMTEDEVGEIRLCEEMAADLSDQTRQSRRSSSVLESSFEALDSSIGEEGVDFLSNLKFDGDAAEE